MIIQHIQIQFHEPWTGAWCSGEMLRAAKTIEEADKDLERYQYYFAQTYPNSEVTRIRIIDE